MDWPVRIRVDLDTGAMVVAVRTASGVHTLANMRSAIAHAQSQRPAGVIVDLSALSLGWAMLLLLVLTNLCARSTVRLFVCVSGGGHALLALATGLSVCPTARDALAQLPGGRVGPHNRRRVHLAPTLKAATTARAMVSEAIRGWHLDHLRTAAELITTELVSNAIRHAQTTFDISLIRLNGSIRVAVRDESPEPPTPVAPGADADLLATGGRGLQLIEAFAVQWGYVIAPGEKVVWAFIGDPAPIKTG
jgi:anti-sigma regulatory factor (Ser/Thr protein kinase)